MTAVASQVSGSGQLDGHPRTNKTESTPHTTAIEGTEFMDPGGSEPSAHQDHWGLSVGAGHKLVGL